MMHWRTEVPSLVPSASHLSSIASPLGKEKGKGGLRNWVSLIVMRNVRLSLVRHGWVGFILVLGVVLVLLFLVSGDGARAVGLITGFGFGACWVYLLVYGVDFTVRLTDRM
jgi:hypothetical protein